MKHRRILKTSALPEAKVMAYRYYLIEKLDIKNPAEKFQPIYVIGEDLGEIMLKVGPVEGPLKLFPEYSIMCKFIKEEDRISNNTTLDTVYGIFSQIAKQKGVDILPFQEFAKDLNLYGRALAIHAGKYTDLHPNTVITSSINDCVSEFLFYKIKHAKSDEERKNLIKMLSVWIGLLISGPITYKSYKLLVKYKNALFSEGKGAKDLNEIDKLLNQNIKLFLSHQPFLNLAGIKIIQYKILLSIILVGFAAFITLKGNDKYVSKVDEKEAIAPSVNFNSEVSNDPFTSMLLDQIKTAHSEIDSANYWYQKAMNEIKMEKALFYLNNAIRIDNKFSMAYLLRAKVHSGLKMYKEALDDLNYIIKYDNSGYDFFYYGYRSMYKKELLQDFSGALNDIDSAISLFPEGIKRFKEYSGTKELIFANLLYGRATCKMNLNKMKEAIPDLKEVLRVYPNKKLLYYENIGTCFYENEQYDSAITYFQFVLLNTDHFELRKASYNFIATAYMQLAVINAINENDIDYQIPLVRNGISYLDSVILVDPSNYERVLYRSKCQSILDKLEAGIKVNYK